MSKIIREGNTFYWIEEVLTCYCDRMYCTGCTYVESKQKLQESPADCINCKCVKTVIPTYFSIPEPRMKRRTEGQDIREGYGLKCSVCGSKV